MHYYWFLPLVVTYFAFSGLALKKAIEIPFIVDFVKSGNSPNMVLDNLCWNRDSKHRLYNTLLTNNISVFSYKFVNNGSTFLYKLLHERYLTFTVITDLSCNFDYFFHEALESNLLVFPNLWIVFGNLSLLEDINYYIPISSVLILPIYDSQSNNWKLMSLYKTNRHLKKYITNYFGTWTPESGLNMTGAIELTRNRSDFMGMPLRVSYVLSQSSSFKHLTDYREKHKDSWTKINVILLQYISDFWNATHIKIYRTDWGFKSIHPTKFFTKGIFADLLNDRADVGGTGSFMRLQHFKYFFAPTQDFSMSFIFRSPPLAFYSNLFALPFSRNVWLVVGLLVILGGVILRLIFIWEETEETFAIEAQQNEENHPKILDVIMMQLAIICQMDFFYEPKSVSGKVVTFVVLMSSTFIYTAYSARIVLLLQSTTESIESMGDLYRAGYDFGVEDHTFNRYYFRGLSNRTNEYWRQLIYENKIKSPSGHENFIPASKGIQQVRDSHFAFHVEHEAAFFLIQKTFTNEQKCAVSLVETIFKSDILYLSVLKNSSYFEFLLVGVRRLAESGLHNREARRCFTKRPRCEGTGSSFVSVGIIECYFAVLIFGIGFVSSLLIFALELSAAFYLKCRSRSRNKVDSFKKA